MIPDPALTVRETAALAGVSKAAVDKAIETEVLGAALGPSKDGVTRRRLPARAVAYFAALKASGLADLPVRHKRQLWEAMGQGGDDGMDAGDEVLPEAVEFAPGARLEVGRLAGEPLRAALAYRDARDRHVVCDPDILGGTPVIRGTRVTVHAVRARLEGGEPVEELMEDYPGVPREAFEAAALYARTHPLRGRPGGRPWRREGGGAAAKDADPRAV